MRYIVAAYTDIVHPINENKANGRQLPALCNGTSVHPSWMLPPQRRTPERYKGIVLANYRWWVEGLPKDKRLCMTCSQIMGRDRHGTG